MWSSPMTLFQFSTFCSEFMIEHLYICTFVWTSIAEIWTKYVGIYISYYYYCMYKIYIDQVSHVKWVNERKTEPKIIQNMKIVAWAFQRHEDFGHQLSRSFYLILLLAVDTYFRHMNSILKSVIFVNWMQTIVCFEWEQQRKQPRNINSNIIVNHVKQENNVS